MFEFFAGVMDDDGGGGGGSSEGKAQRHDLPSPDAITVTTEFGVVQEPANFTMVSAAGPSAMLWQHEAEGFYDEEHGEESTVEMTEDVDDNDTEDLGVSVLPHTMANLHIPHVFEAGPSADGLGAGALHAQHEDEEINTGAGNDADDDDADDDAEDDDAEAETAFINAFIQDEHEDDEDEDEDDEALDGTITPTTTTSTTGVVGAVV